MDIDNLRGSNSSLGIINDLLNPTHQPTPEQKLWLRVMLNALEEYASSRRGMRRRRPTDLETWISPEFEYDNGPCSFNYVCLILGIDSSAARSALRKTTPDRVRCLLKDEGSYRVPVNSRYIDDNRYYVRHIHHKKENGHGNDENGEGATAFDNDLSEENTVPPDGD